MKTGDMVMQSEMVARWANKKRLAFIGDGDAISVCICLLAGKKPPILPYGPSRKSWSLTSTKGECLGAIGRFAEKQQITNLNTILYNVVGIRSNKRAV